MNYQEFFSKCCQSREFFRSNIATAKVVLIFEELISICHIHNLNIAILA